jgi:AraC family transcriptional activator of pobA
MEKKDSLPRKFKSLSDLHRVFGQILPFHPLISLIDISINKIPIDESFHSFATDFYQIIYKPDMHGKARYGQNHYDFAEGGLIFSAPNQIFEAPPKSRKSGYVLSIHPDFLLSYPLAKKIKQYGFFSYSANEALHLSDQEKETIMSIFKIIDEELKSRIDDFTHEVIISQLELSLNYCNRFYKRQFTTRQAVNNDLLSKMEEILDTYFNDNESLAKALPTVQYLAEQLNTSPSYLSDMLRYFTGQNAQHHIHNKLIEKAKEKLSTTENSISEIAYLLGFEHPQSFSKLFKAKTNISPSEFRQSFN